MFLSTADGELIAAKAIVHVGKLESWPHGNFYPVTYRMHDADITAYVPQSEVEDAGL